MSAKTYGNCKHAVIPPPRMSKHRVPRFMRQYPGKCAYPEPVQPMVALYAPTRTAVWAGYDATACQCFEPRVPR